MRNRMHHVYAEIQDRHKKTVNFLGFTAWFLYFAAKGVGDDVIREFLCNTAAKKRRDAESVYP
ncbi:hypothetical protein [Poriferisphaera corsica]|uniref:hypothetical protein n=1 Tax=Poriferisphaera corsica TaxID=2528020 RepID=UPI0011A95D7C|nr:hypothetical protein [Poriferisphaera corsica]